MGWTAGATSCITASPPMCHRHPECKLDFASLVPVATSGTQNDNGRTVSTGKEGPSGNRPRAHNRRSGSLTCSVGILAFPASVAGDVTSLLASQMLALSSPSSHSTPVFCLCFLYHFRVTVVLAPGFIMYWVLGILSVVS